MSDLRQEINKCLMEFTVIEEFGNNNGLQSRRLRVDFDRCAESILAAFKKRLPEVGEDDKYIYGGAEQYRKEVLERLDAK